MMLNFRLLNMLVGQKKQAWGPNFAFELALIPFGSELNKFAFILLIALQEFLPKCKLDGF